MQDYRQCPCGEKVAIDGIVRRCPSCNRPVDRTWKIVYQKAEPVQSAGTDPQALPQRRIAVGAASEQQADAFPAPVIEKRTRQPLGTSAPQPMEYGPQKGLQNEASTEKKQNKSWRLDYFGQKLCIPPQNTVCLGRNSMGAEFFEGNQLVSRKHLYLWVNGAGQLLAEDRESLNGSWYTRKNQRIPLEHGVSVRLMEDDVIWLYNIPLKVEQFDGEDGVDGIS